MKTYIFYGENAGSFLIRPGVFNLKKKRYLLATKLNLLPIKSIKSLSSWQSWLHEAEHQRFRWNEYVIPH